MGTMSRTKDGWTAVERFGAIQSRKEPLSHRGQATTLWCVPMLALECHIRQALDIRGESGGEQERLALVSWRQLIQNLGELGPAGEEWVG